MYYKTKKHNILYLTKNLINNKIYIGVHSTDNLNDGYMGSGLNIRRAINKYGKKNFKRYILIDCDNLELVYNLESKIVNQEFLDKNISYNIEQGGYRGKHSKEVSKRIGLAHKNRFFPREHKLKLSAAKKGKCYLDKNNNAKKIINTVTGKTYNTLKEAAVEANINYTTFKWNMRYKKGEFNYKYIEDGVL